MAKNKENENANFENLCENAYASLKAKVLALTRGDLYMAEEVVHDTYEIALKKKKELLSHPDFDGWLYKTARYIYYEKLRKNKKYKKMQEQFILDVSTSSIFNDENFDRLYKILDKLSEKECEIIRLLFQDKRSVKEISDMLNENHETTRKSIYRLMIKLKNLFFEKDRI